MLLVIVWSDQGMSKTREDSMDEQTSLRRPARQQPAYARVVEQIKEKLSSGELSPGDQLLPERQIAEKLGVSRSSAREALATLAGMGLIEVTARDGAYVRRRSLDDVVEPLAEILFQERESVFHLFEVRSIIETQAARLAAQRHDEADVRRLRELSRRVSLDVSMSRPADESDTRFHAGIVETAKNPLLTKVMGSLVTALMEVYSPARRQILADPDEARAFVSEHEGIVDAIAAGDPGRAAEATAQHIDHARQLLQSLQAAGVHVSSR